jgi:hypothetical protein
MSRTRSRVMFAAIAQCFFRVTWLAGDRALDKPGEALEILALSVGGLVDQAPTIA